MTTARRVVALMVAAAFAAPAACCPSVHGTADAGAGPATSSSASSSPASSRLRQLLVAEVARTPEAIHEDDVASGDVAIRREAARALARSEDVHAQDRLLELLADADPDVLSWAAFGLGQICASSRDTITQRLVLRGASYRAEPQVPIRGLDPSWAIPRALGRCGQATAERTLVAWLAGPRERAGASALALGDLAARQHRLEEETSAALLRAVTGDAAQEPLPEAFYPFAKLKQAPPRARELLLKRAQARLSVASPERVFAVRAMVSLGVEAVTDLRVVLATPASFTPEERAEAARSLGKIGGDEARSALVSAIDALAPTADPVALTALVGPSFPPLWTAVDVLGGLGPSPASPSEGLGTLSKLPVLPDAPPALQRRLTMLRCAAARVLVGKDPDAKLLVGCDPDAKGESGALTRIAVLGTVPLRGGWLVSWRAYTAETAPAVVREAALELAASHPEISGLPAVLATALRAKEPGVVAVAAEQIASHPDKVLAEAPKASKPAGKAQPDEQLDAGVAKALAEALGRTFPDDAVETRAQLALAAGAVRFEGARGWLQDLCKSPNVTLRASAQTALSSLDRNKTTCPAQGAAAAPLPAELDHLEPASVELKFATDVGELKMTLDPTLAPIAVTRIAGLARKGFYDGMTVHRVVAGFVVQFGDPGGDGYGGDGQPPLRCELSPVAFDAGSVGIATAGRDTGSSQVFVTMAPEPHLDGNYTWIGKAQGPWNALAPGDVIQHVTVGVPSP